MNTAVDDKRLQNEFSAVELDDIDRQIVVASQDGLPLDPRPYAAIASQLDISVTEVMQRMHRMHEMGVIRRIGAVPNHYALGYRGNGMTVWDVPDELIDELGRQVGELEFVSHCYHRPRYLPDWPYNLFAMVHAPTREEALQLVDTIAALLGEHDRGHSVLFSSRILKKTGMRFQP